MVRPEPAMPRMRPRVRDSIAAVATYVPGARPDARPMWRLASNENPSPIHPAVRSAIAGAGADVQRYPDNAAIALRERLAARHGIDPDRVVTANGSVALVDHLLETYCEAGDEVIYPWRSFEIYPIAVAITGAESVRIPLRPDGAHDLDAMARAITPATAAIILCSPNNPTGTALRDDEVRDFLARVPADVLVILDVAYLEYVRAEDAVDCDALIADFPNVVVLRTFSKAYGLAGLRIGYAIGDADVLRPVRPVCTPFGTNLVAQAAALAALGVEDDLLAIVDGTTVERERVLEAVRSFGWDVPEAEGNFFWLPLGEHATAFVDAAREAGILVRGFAGDGVRVTIGEVEANDAVIELLCTWRVPQGAEEGAAARS